MDPVLTAIVLGVVSNGLTSLLARAGSEWGTSVVNVEDAVRRAVDQLTEVPAIDEGVGGERLRDFLNAPESGRIVQGLFTASAIDEPTTVPMLRQQFRDLFRAWVPDVQNTDAHADRLFEVLVVSAEAALDSAIADGALSAADAKAAARHRATTSQLSAIAQTLDALAQPNTTPLSDILRFAATYRQQVAGREGVITPPHLDNQQRLPIGDLYVPANFQTRPREDDEPSRTFSYDGLVASMDREVILGNPGSGKSTLARKLTTDCAQGAGPPGVIPSDAVPFLIVLRDYGAEKTSTPLSVLEFIERRAKSHYQVEPPQDAVHYLLTSGRAIVIFDGLDELLDTRYRREITADIESFARLYPSVPIVVTSREVGYDQAPVDPRTFNTHQLTEFDDDQIREYVEKWFRQVKELTPAEKEDALSNFLEDSAVVPDLRSNALMLALMCNIYRGAKYIPRNRPEVYEKCAVMLFERWDSDRGITVSLTIERHLRPAMQFLAQWIYSDSSLHSGVPEALIIERTTEYLMDRRFEDRDEAEREAARFVAFCKGRAWVFTDTGTEPGGQSLYQFTHTTFLEFFTAEHLVRTNPTPDALIEVLRPRVAEGEWDVVAQLAVQIQDMHVDMAADRHLELLLPGQTDIDSVPDGLTLSFLARCLNFLVPSPSVTRDVARAVVHRLVTATARSLESDRRAADAPHESLDALLLHASPENRAPIDDVVQETLLETINGDVAAEAEIAAEVGLHLAVGARSSDRRAPLEEMSAEILSLAAERIRMLASSDVRLSIDLCCQGQMAPSTIAESFGVLALFTGYDYRFYPAHGRQALAHTISTHAVLRDGPRLPDERVVQQAADLGRTLSKARPPWYDATGNPIRIGILWNFTYDRNRGAWRDEALLRGEAAFGCIAVLAEMTEESAAHDDSSLETFLQAAEAGELGAVGQFTPILRARLDGDADGLESAFETLGIGPDQRDLLRSWAQGTVDFAQGLLPSSLSPNT